MKRLFGVILVLSLSTASVHAYSATVDVWIENGDNPAGGQFEIYAELTDLPAGGEVTGIAGLSVPLAEATYNVGSLVNELPASWYRSLSFVPASGMAALRSGEGTNPENPVAAGQYTIGPPAGYVLLPGIGMEVVDIEAHVGFLDDIYLPSEHVPGQTLKYTTVPALVGYGY